MQQGYFIIKQKLPEQECSYINYPFPFLIIFPRGGKGLNGIGVRNFSNNVENKGCFNLVTLLSKEGNKVEALKTSLFC